MKQKNRPYVFYQFPFLKVGKMVLNKNPENYFNEVEQTAFGTGVLVDGLDFSRMIRCYRGGLFLFR
jgi:catalase